MFFRAAKSSRNWIFNRRQILKKRSEEKCEVLKVEFIYYISAFILTCFGVEIFRRWTLKRQILDIPNERSSHTAPTPRGGGIIFVGVSLLFCIVWNFKNTALNFNSEVWTYIFGAILLSSVSWLDDLKSVPSLLRFAVHFVSASLIIYGFGSIQAVFLPFIGEPELSHFAVPITLLWIVWLTNAYNFMDGIDGIAAIQAITAGIGWYLLGFKYDIPFTAFFGLILALTNLGFIFHNWSPARIFMGDVGSAFLGFAFAFLPLSASKESGQNSAKFAIIAVLFVLPFIFDTVFTFVRRLLNGEKVWQAHRTHLYQRLVIRGYSHRFVTTLYGIISMLIIAATLIFV
jgi:UDP-N-acetylmuramyl pentapeptide phosphotransferase/UDP-N-acetylglucosamine-1-phosphate transferase